MKWIDSCAYPGNIQFDMERTVTFSKCSVGKQNNYNVSQNEEEIMS